MWYSLSHISKRFIKLLEFTVVKTGRHDIVEMLLKVSLKHKKSNTSINRITIHWHGEYNIQFVINLK
jgi:hypothetical protein